MIVATVLVGLAGVYYFVVIPARCKAALARETAGPAVARSAYDELRAIPFGGRTADLSLAGYWDRRADQSERSGDPAEAVLARLRALELDATQQRVQSARCVTSLFADLLSTVVLSPDRRRGDEDVVAISRDGTSVITIDRAGAGTVWDGLPKPNPRRLRFAGKITAAAFAAGRTRLATVSTRGIATVWDPGGMLLASFRRPEPITAVALSGDGARIAIAGRDTVRVWDVASGRASGRTLHCACEVTAITFAGGVLWTGCSDGTVRDWDPSTGEHRISVRTEGRVRALSGSGRTLLVAVATGTVDAVDMATGKLVARRFVHGRDLRSVCVLAGGTVACTGGDATVRTWRLVAPEPSPVIAHPAAVYVAEFSAGGATLVTGSSDFLARLFDVANGQPKGRPMKHEGGVLAIAVHGKLVVTGSRDGAARIWDSATGRLVGTAMHHPDWVIAVAISGDGKRIATGSLDGCARLWDATTQAPIGKPMRHRGWLYALAFSPDGSRLLTGSDDGTARMWDVSSQTQNGPVMRHEQGVTAVAFAPEGELAATASLDGRVRLWSVKSCQRIGRPLIHPNSVWGVWFAPSGAVLSATRATVHRTPVIGGRLDPQRSLAVPVGWPLAVLPLDAYGTRIAVAGLADGSQVTTRVIDFAALNPSGADAGSLARVWGERLGCEIAEDWLIVPR